MLLAGNSEIPVVASGFMDMTRPAGGEPEMWLDIFLTNRKAIISALYKFDDAMVEFRDMLELGDIKAIQRLLEKAKKRRGKTIINRPNESPETAE